MLPKQNASKRETALLQQPQAFALQPWLLAHLPPCTTLPGHWCCADLQEDVAKATWTQCCPSRAQPSYCDCFVAATANVRAFRGDQPALHNSTWPLVLRRLARGGGEGYLDKMLPKQSAARVP